MKPLVVMLSLQKIMGYSDISVTAKIYTHMVDEVFEQNRKRLEQYANKSNKHN